MEISCKFALYAMPLSWLWLLATQQMSDVHGVLSSRTLLSSCRLMPRASFMESLHLIFGLPLSLLPSIFPNSIVFSKEPHLPMMCPKLASFTPASYFPRSFQFLSSQKPSPACFPGQYSHAKKSSMEKPNESLKWSFLSFMPFQF